MSRLAGGLLVSPVFVSAATTNATSLKATGGAVHAVWASNAAAAMAYLKVYNKASAPTVGTDVPVLVIGIPPGGSISRDLGADGLALSSGIALATTTAAATADTGAVGAGDVVVTVLYR